MARYESMGWPVARGARTVASVLLALTSAACAIGGVPSRAAVGGTSSPAVTAISRSITPTVQVRTEADACADLNRDEARSRMRLTVVPDEPTPGTEVRLVGGGFPINTVMIPVFGPAFGEPALLPGSSVTSDASGAVDVTVQLPPLSLRRGSWVVVGLFSQDFVFKRGVAYILR